MFFRQVLYRDLGCASYVVADAGEAIVVDPRFDIDIYLEIAREEGHRILHVVDTHDHADHMSGRVRLADRTGAVAHRPARDSDPRAEDLAPGDELRVGRVSVRAVATPGHRPEHLAFVVIDDSRAPDPWMLLSGDSILVGDLARPDLAVEPRAGAADLRASLRGLIDLGEHIEIWPGHVGGSLCGGPGLSGKTSSTIGYEVRTNPLLVADQEDFVDRLVANVPSRPPNISHIVEANRRTVPAEPLEPYILEPEELHELMHAGATVLDARDPRSFDEGHIAGAINLPATMAAIGTRAGWALGPDEPIVIAAHDERAAQKMTLALHAVGLWRILGVSLNWDGLELATARSWTLEQLAHGMSDRAVDLVDVRDPLEWRAGHVGGSIHLPLARLGDGQDIGLPVTGRTTAVACAAGTRAAFAASLLRRGGWNDVVRVSGGGVADLAGHGFTLVGGEA